MLIGYKKSLAVSEKYTLPAKNMIFITSGGTYIDGLALNSGDGYFCAGNDGAEVLSLESGAECLILDFSETSFPSALAERGISGGGAFKFAPSPLFLRIADCFFDGCVEYGDPMLISGISDALLSFIEIREPELDRSERIVSLTEIYIRENLHLPIRIDDIAEHFSLSRGYLRNIFATRHGMPPQEFLVRCRIERACELLSTTYIPVSEVAAAVGYTDALGFSRIFKKKIGCSPLKYREGNSVIHDNTISNNDISISSSKAERSTAHKKPSLADTVEINLTTAPQIESEPQDELDLTSALAAQIERAAQAAREKEEAEKRSSPTPFWLL